MADVIPGSDRTEVRYFQHQHTNIYGTPYVEQQELTYQTVLVQTPVFGNPENPGEITEVLEEEVEVLIGAVNARQPEDAFEIVEETYNSLVEQALADFLTGVPPEGFEDPMDDAPTGPDEPNVEMDPAIAAEYDPFV